MGQAKIRKIQADNLLRNIEGPVARVGAALRKLATSASAQLGGDCFFHAEMGRTLLSDEGVESRLVVGYAAWRVGHGDSDVIAHGGSSKGLLPEGVTGLTYHAWLEVGDCVIDFTTYSLRLKAQQLDDLDGGNTTAEWCPEYLMIRRSACLSFNEVTQSAGPGVVHYAEQPGLANRLEELAGERYELDPEDVKIARIILANPDAAVLGPREMGLTQERSSPS